jgi:hypothetical protein
MLITILPNSQLLSPVSNRFKRQGMSFVSDLLASTDFSNPIKLT